MSDHITVAPLLSLSDLGKILGLGHKALYIRASQHPELLPPRFVLPGSRLLRWHASVVKQWMDERAGLAPSFSCSEQSSNSQKRRPGRPLKSEQIARQKRGER